MTREKLTKGNIEFLSALMDAYQSQMLHDVDDAKKKSTFAEVSKFRSSKNCFHGLEELGQILPQIERPNAGKDETAYVSFTNGWETIAFEKMAREFGRFGAGTISSLAELLLYTNALALPLGAKNVFYRGEHHYGYKLQSRAQRNMADGDGVEPGITGKELEELHRFQKEFRADIPYDFQSAKELPDNSDPMWLPIMQHYDEKFGTRMIDITSSPFAGLYFACVSWDGNIASEKDGLVYSFYLGGAMRVRGSYFDMIPDKYDEWDELPVENVKDSFKSWKSPEYWRIYQSSFGSPREIAQDGWFLLQGALTDKVGFGQGFKFRIPGEVKKEIAKELWLAGYTPSRMVRGPIGKEAHKNLGAALGF